jgi:polyisoprenoid-binding protein YceI
MVGNTATTRTVAGHELPAPGRWRIDNTHSALEFVARHMMIAKVRGRFRTFSGVIQIAPDPEQSSLETIIDAATIDTGDPDRDAHLRSPEFLDVQRYPHILYHSTDVRGDGDRWAVTGDLTVRDVTRAVTLSVEFCGVARDPWGKTRAGFLAQTEINREDFAVTWNQVLETGGFLVGKGIKIEADVEAVFEEQ